ncbi:DNA/RNA nuclease SfsA [Sedimentibacter hydroxybenzoicus DSM 7310]|uniref:Sugar fermentation stimulation protein homolog n=1 Tax=Sedimentibacter hydroxybenzoicus DSM 7310 TaxID=1123245 RepID=A0A974BMD3_SEDHY|nr:DNA/RNA nuclease SfsA [Sedimentibacter hydroxybenzoicus]NYB75613.1 DNA/RNA nuclease SfsA [Sedimentibacter hydroxybenzoicus DSM 7310]
MLYDNIKTAKFISRPNRFIANIEINGEQEVCHVKNTGRCKELLTEGVSVYVQEFCNSSQKTRKTRKARKTQYDLISVFKGERLINIDSQAPNKVFHELLLKGELFNNITLIKPECKYKNSRFDFYVEADDKKIFVEVKGVTLEENGVVMFPDAPTERGLKHLNELGDSIDDGYEAYVCFIIQMKDVLYFTPNYKTHKEFGETLKNIKEKGVKIIAFDCEVKKDSITAVDVVDIILSS